MNIRRRAMAWPYLKSRLAKKTRVRTAIGQDAVVPSPSEQSKYEDFADEGEARTRGGDCHDLGCAKSIYEAYVVAVSLLLVLRLADAPCAVVRGAAKDGATNPGRTLRPAHDRWHCTRDVRKHLSRAIHNPTNHDLNGE